IARRLSGQGVARIGVGWVDSSGTVLRYDTKDTASLTEELVYVAGVEIPPGTVYARVFAGHRDAATGSASVRGMILTRGPVPQTPARLPAAASAQNLLPAMAWAGTITVATGQTRYPGSSAATANLSLEMLGLQPGDVVSYSVVARVDAPGGVARLALGWVDAQGNATYLSNAVVDYTGTDERWLRIDGYMIPEGAVALRPIVGERGTGTAYFHSPMLHRGDVCVLPEAPPGRPGRER